MLLLPATVDIEVEDKVAEVVKVVPEDAPVVEWEEAEEEPEIDALLLLTTEILLSTWKVMIA